MPTRWNGNAATEEQLEFLALNNYGNYTFLQVRRNTVHGLALHLERLRANAAELFGSAPSADLLRELLAQAVPPEGSCSLRVSMISQDLEALLSGVTVEPDVVVTTSAPKPSSTAAVTVRTVDYERDTPWIKHRATHSLTRHTRMARQDGFDDALFVDRLGAISEGTTWNTCLWREGIWVWTAAAVLPGVTMQLLQQQLAADGVQQEVRRVPVSDVAQYQAAFALNATSPARPIGRIDGHTFTGAGAAAVQLEQAWRAITADAL